jgi:sulfur carrier protein
MTVVVNGVSKELPEGTTVAELLASLDLPPSGRGVAVARNGDVVLRSEWNDTHVDSGDRIEILHAVQGG